ncbi:MarR family winged helix-turn-helix transcriptional regulator [Streptomyces phaeochromogenes]|uniref:MarR family winged helix-turn-helix transcriptional regulator n=1 Tax=Streptomyces phaeochromogenes TaxID=1923 RepID=UPI0038632185|nr:MarR family transcriptional regulator [Streptomyces phaeochromogenes]WTA01311.1 MarR family transcriptional regulator [Streptomyces phaeochromogenes]
MADWPLVPDEEAFAPGSLLRTAQQVHDRLWQELVPGGCTSPQFAVLHRLALRPGIDQRTLGEAAGLDRATGAELLARLEQSGLIRRERAAADARRNSLRLTVAGDTALRACAPWVAQVQLRLTAPLGDAGTGRILRLLRTVAEVATGQPVGQELPEIVGLPADPSRIPGHLVRVAQQRHTQFWTAAVGERPTSPQYGVLYRLAREPGIDQTTLADRIALAKAPTGEIVKRLVARGEVLRDVDPGDARRRLLTLSPQGRQVLRDVTPAVLRVQEELTAELTADERRELLTLLRRITRP